MEFTGRIMKVCELRTGVSERTGNEWRSQGFIFEYFENPTDRYSDKVYLETFDENIIPLIAENLPVRIGFGHRVREYTNPQGKTMQINEIRMYKFEALAPAANQPSQQANGQSVGQQPAQQAQAQQQAPFPPQVDENGNPVTNQGGENDDLPF